MWLKWFPWKWMVRQIARRKGFLDPLSVLAHLRRFSQPSEVAEPIELLRAGMVFHARGLMNSRAIQQNLDWVWPYWIERQFDPEDESFIPRAYSLTHVNLTHRNWTALGRPGSVELPLVDPRGLVTPFFDGWSLDAWLVRRDGGSFVPSQSGRVEQTLEYKGSRYQLLTRGGDGGSALESVSEVIDRDGQRCCRIGYTVRASSDTCLAVSLRPYNPEGVRFVHRIQLDDRNRGWLIDHKERVHFDQAVDRHAFSEYHQGDVFHHLLEQDDRREVVCQVGMPTAAALFECPLDHERHVEVTVPLEPVPEEAALSSLPPVRAVGAEERGIAPASVDRVEDDWEHALQGCTRLRHPHTQYQQLFDIALRNLVLHSPDDVVPGPYTYKRFWFRDAAFILNAMLSVGLTDRAGRAIDRFEGRQTAMGYFLSQNGEWDANGEAIWAIHRCHALTNKPLPDHWWEMVRRGANWIIHKRGSDHSGKAHAGLFPAGFSAEHLGPNDYYYWDDFWGVAGLRCAAAMAEDQGDEKQSADYARHGDAFSRAIQASLSRDEQRLGVQAMPASPYRRLDSGAVGSIVAGYPLALVSARNTRLLATLEYLMDHCLVNGGFFQDMVHSGINAYLTLHLAEGLLQAGDSRAMALMDTVAQLASPTGQWPEAIHTRTGGGCMGDGQHLWAAAEWVMIIRNSIVYEDPHYVPCDSDSRGQWGLSGELAVLPETRSSAAVPSLVLGAGIDPGWLEEDHPLELGPTLTAWGAVSVSMRIVPESRCLQVAWQGQWYGSGPVIRIRIPGLPETIAEPDQGHCSLELAPASLHSR